MVSGSIEYFCTKSARYFSGVGGGTAYNMALLGSAEVALLVGRVGRDFKDYAQHLEEAGVCLDYLEGAMGPCAYSFEGSGGPGSARFLKKEVMARAVKAPELAYSDNCAIWYLGPEHFENTLLLAKNAIRYNKPYILEPGFSLPELMEVDSAQVFSFKDALHQATGLVVTQSQLDSIETFADVWSQGQNLKFLVNWITLDEVELTLKDKTSYRFKIENPQNCDAIELHAAFNGGFLHGYLQEWPIEKCAKIGQALAYFAQYGQKHKPSIQLVYEKAFGLNAP